VREIAAKGGRASGKGDDNGTEDVQDVEDVESGTQERQKGAQGFASMDPDKQREIASKGGKASSGSFEPGSEKAAEAGRKGGSK
jgi:general stress protein YciG